MSSAKTAGTSLRASQLICREGVQQEGVPRGYGLLLRHGYVVELAPGLASGFTLFQRSLSRLSERCRQTFLELSAQELSLPASEGSALINLVLHGGAAQATELVSGFVLGAGFRHGGPAPRGLYDMPLYQRFDAVVVASAADAPAEWMTRAVDGLLSHLDLSVSRRDADEDHVELVVAIPGVEEGEVIGRIRRGALEGTGRELALVSLDLCALLGVVADVHSDEQGLAWPAGLAPFDVGLLVVKPSDAAACALIEKVRVDLLDAGFDVLVDDRPLDAASRRKAVEAWGLPLRVLAGPSANQGELLLEQRRVAGPPERVAQGELLARVRQALGRSANESGSPLRRRANF
ncbi:MAG: hypothetical protein ACI9EF_001317 [Pseudohongiellaceae bacterium]